MPIAKYGKIPMTKVKIIYWKPLGSVDIYGKNVDELQLYGDVIN